MAKTVTCAVLITYIDPNDASNPISLILDTVQDVSIQASSTVTTHPTVAGTPMADHMYKEPVTMSIAGTFSVDGKKGIVVDKAGRSLARVESMFEDIKNKGILCTVSKIRVVGGDGQTEIPQFSVRENMVLQSITWTEKINSLSFAFTFTEVIRATIQEYEVDPDDKFAPDITYAEASNFSDTLINWDAVDEEVLRALRDYNLCADDFLQYLATTTAGGFVAIALGTVVALALAKTLIALGFAASTIPVVGAVIAAAAALVIGIFALIKLVKQRAYKIKAFKYYKNVSKRKSEEKRFIEFYDSIHNKIVELNGAIKVWSVTEDKPQETLVNIDGSYYIFNFSKNNTDESCKYSFNVSDINGVSIINGNVNKARSSFTDCTEDNALFKTTNTFVYLIRNEKGDKNDLTSYFICASNINPKEYAEVLTKIIQEAIKY